MGGEARGERLKLGRAGMPGARQTYRSAHFSQRQTIHAAFFLQRKIMLRERGWKISFKSNANHSQYYIYEQEYDFWQIFFQQYKRGNRCVNWKYGKITVFRYF